MRVLICGGRDFHRYVFIYDTMDAIEEERPVSHVIVGGAPGADYWGEAWAYHNRKPFTVFKAEWKRYGSSAGPRRNARMLVEGKPDIVVAFPRANGEWGKGTLNMISQAEAAGIEVHRIAP